jgi:hypothetical protein
MKGVQVCLDKGSAPPQRGDNKKCKYRVGSLTHLLNNHWVKKAQMCKKTSLHSVKSNLLKPWFTEVGRGAIRETLLSVFQWENL